MGPSRAWRLLTCATAAILSEWHSMYAPAHLSPHTAAASTMGSSSLKAMEETRSSSRHWICNQLG